MITSAFTMRPSSEPAAVLVALRRIVRYLRVADREVESALGLSAAQLFVLHSLAESPASSLAELAERTLTDQSSVSTVVAKLVARKLVVRRPGTDRRRATIRLSPAGERVVLAAPRAPQISIIAALKAMTAPRRGAVGRALEHLAAAIGANEVAPAMLFEDEPRRRKS
jgi:DNA-binding MarR family transcriptional regulator